MLLSFGVHNLTDIMLKNRRWQPVPGTDGMEIYPIIRKPDVCCSNAFILRDRAGIIVIDTGAREDQMDEITAVIESCLAEAPRPVAVILTHCHIDHCYQMVKQQGIGVSVPVTVIAHEEAEKVLRNADHVQTAAELYGWEITPFQVDLPLFPGGGATKISSGPIRVVPGPAPGDRTQLPSTRLQISGGEWLTVYHTPGHSPDSICVRVGKMLFVGDLPFASQPGINRIAGCDLPLFCHTIPCILDLFEGDDIQICCPGHGNALTAATTAQILRSALADGQRVRGGSTFDPLQLRESMEHAGEILEEAYRLFSVIIGKLLYLAWWMEELGEEEAAARYQNLVDADRIETVLADFGGFVDQFRAGEVIEVQVVLKAIQVLQKISRSFTAECLDHLIDPSLLRRADRLMTDFLNTVGGLSCPGQREEVDLLPLLEDVAGWCQHATPDEEIISAADDADQFCDALAERIIRIPVCGEVVVDCKPVPRVMVADPIRLKDLLIGVIEELAADGVKQVRLSHRVEERLVTIVIESGRDFIWREERIRVIRRQGVLCGVSVAMDGPAACTISLPLATATKNPSPPSTP